MTQERAQMVLGTATNEAVSRLTDAWLEGDGAAGLSIIHDALASGTDARQFCRQMVVYLRRLLLMQASGSDITPDGPVERHKDMLRQAKRAQRLALIEAIKQFNEAAITPAGSWQPQLPLELAFIEMLPVATETLDIKPQPVTPEPAPAASLPGPATAAVATGLPGKPAQPESDDSSDETAPDFELDATADVEPESAAGSPTTGQPLTLQRVTAHWREMLNQVGQQNKNLPALLNMGKPLAVEGQTLVLGFDYPIFKEKFDNTAGATQLIGETFSELLQVQCHVRCVVSSDYPIVVSKEEFKALAQELGGVVSDD